MHLKSGSNSHIRLKQLKIMLDKQISERSDSIVINLGNFNEQFDIYSSVMKVIEYISDGLNRDVESFLKNLYNQHLNGLHSVDFKRSSLQNQISKSNIRELSLKDLIIVNRLFKY